MAKKNSLALIESLIEVIANFATNAIPGQPINTIGSFKLSIDKSNFFSIFICNI